MVNNVIARFKAARKGPRINWVPYTKDGKKNIRFTEEGDDGEWAFNAVSEEGSAKWVIQITAPSTAKIHGTYEWPKPFRAEKVEEAKKELGHYIDQLRLKGTIDALPGWKKA